MTTEDFFVVARRKSDEEILEKLLTGTLRDLHFLHVQVRERIHVLGQLFPRFTSTTPISDPESEPAKEYATFRRVEELIRLAISRRQFQQPDLDGSKVAVKIPEPRTAPSMKSARRKAVDDYIEEVREKTGKCITRKDIWKKARYTTRTEFERWERHDLKNPNKTADERFTTILKEKPHLN